MAMYYSKNSLHKDKIVAHATKLKAKLDAVRKIGKVGKKKK